MRAANPVLIVSMALCAAIGIWGVFAPVQMSSAALAFTGYALDSLDWLFMAVCTLFLALSVFLAFGPYGHVKLGADDEEPEFDTVSWLSMLFAGGMGGGILFWGVAEPIYHFTSPPGQEGLTPEAARTAFAITNLHWGLHAWSIYAVCALVIGYFSFRRNAPTMVSTPIAYSLGPLLGPRVTRGVSSVADIIGVLAVVFGMAGSLAMGALMTRSGMNEVFGTPNNNMMSIIILVVMTVAFIISACTGVDKGIKILSNTNMVMAIAVMLFVIIVGPTTFILDVFITSIGDYLSSIVQLSFRIFSFDGELRDWTHGWTLTYLIWWIAWGPFVGIFIARISRGRTIREFCLGVILVPTIFSMLWFAVFGGTGVYIEMFGAGGLSELVFEDVSRALYGFFGYLPWTLVLNTIIVLLVFIFLVTGADSGTFVIAMMTSDGDLNPSTRQKVMWGLIMAAITAGTLLSGSVEIAKAMAITGAIPYTFIVLLQLVGFLRALREERPGAPREAVTAAAPARSTAE
ncbi:BCCT family transporter [Inquilinus sp. CAU 1745]|uniref:BCCT family transporter n=1 Tax=Inquilinus sp. CAU 1745 TaxID=3140369 RepID=UPI00325BA028